MTDMYFTSEDGIHYSRRLHGRERLSATNTHYADGYSQTVSLGEVQLKSRLSQEQLAPYVKAAWTQLRFMVPWMAMRTSSINPKDNSFLYSYEVPRNQDDINAWADETIVWRHEQLEFAEWDVMLKQTFWRPGDNRHGLELHIAALPNGHWMMGLTAPHWVTDGRGIFPVTNQYFYCLQAELEGTSQPVSSINWGDEVIRLPATGVKILPYTGALPEKLDPPPSQFTRPTKHPQVIDSEAEIISRYVVLTKEQTHAFNALCKRYGCSVTAGINSVLILADIEAELRHAADAKGKVWEDVLTSFDTSAYFTVPVNVCDLRQYLYPVHAKVQPCSTGGLINCGFPTYHDMKHIRNCIQISPDGSIVKDFGPKSFWDGLVTDTRNVLQKGIQKYTSPRIYHHVSINAEKASPSVTEYQWTTPGIMASSLGNFEKLSWFSRFRPSVALSEPRTAFTVHQWRFGVRTVWQSAIVINTWEYDGNLSLNLQGSSLWQTETIWNYFSDAVVDGFQRITSAKAAL